MGVHSLWDILSPSSRSVRLEALSRKKMAVDASIWIYQFLKAVRDKEGHSLRNSHIVGFFRRICKLLYFGILPVFVFDGGAPALKRLTISRRKERRRDKLETLQQTAQKLLAIQLQRRANEEYQKEAVPKRSRITEKLAPVPENLEFTSYYEDNDYLSGNTAEVPTKAVSPPKEKKLFRKDDDYHLPDMGNLIPDQSDDRIITDWEFKRLTEGLENELEGVDLENIDPASQSFKELPIATQYMVLSHLRLRSRLRMGYTKEQLETLFPNRMDFSKFQISMVQKRNFLTQKLMNVAGMDNTEIVTTRRIAGERGREYQLVKNEDGYTLSLLGDGNSLHKPIELDETGNVIKHKPKEESDDDDDEFEFEDVPLEELTQKGDEFQLDDIDLLFKETESKMIDSYKNSGSYEAKDSASDELERLLMFHRNANNFERENTVESVSSILTPQTQLQPQLQPQSFKSTLSFNPVNVSNPTPQPQSLKSALTAHTVSEVKNEAVSYPKKPEQLKSPENPVMPNFSFKKSMLFSKLTPTAENPSVPRANDRSNITPTDIEQPKEVTPEIRKPEEMKEKDVNEEKQKAQPAPEWFGKSQVGFGKSNPFITDYSIYNKRKETSNDEAAGLISMEQAREFISDQEEEEEELNQSDLEIIEDPNKTVEKESIPAPLPLVEVVSDEDKPNEDKPNEPPAFEYDFSESEEEELVEQLMQEEIEHERFKSTLNTNSGPKWNMDNEKQLLEQRRKDRRDADEVTQTMIQDVQELLSRFGIPFITAPMEAEAQCAEIYKIGLVDGIITDDSDCFLFGGNMIYKNMFSEKNYVECYIMEDIERDLGLTQDKMIELAMLLGSDYTEGIKGVGKVTLMEILAEFQNDDNKNLLVNFRNWWIDYQNGVKIDPQESSVRKKLRKSFQGKLFLDMGFPDPLVREAYLKPDVDDDRTEFQWGTPDLDKLRTFLMYNIGWSQDKVDEVLVPVIRDINKKQQTTISEFFPRDINQTRKELSVGKRLKEATKKLKTNKKQKI